jgi:hypothetical protein
MSSRGQMKLRVTPKLPVKDIKLHMLKVCKGKVTFRFKGHSTLQKVSEGLSFSRRLKMASDETTQMMMTNGY